MALSRRGSSGSVEVIGYVSSEPIELSLVFVSVFTSGGVWIKPADCSKFKVWVIGGGGGGGGAQATGSSQGAGGGGGGGGGCAIKYLSSVTTSVVVSVGAGAVLVSGALNGRTGGISFFGAYCTATGGVGGTTVSAAASGVRSGGAGGVGENGDTNIAGQAGAPVIAAGATFGCASGVGGSSFMGGGATVSVPNASGVAGGAYGGGGSGGCNSASQATAKNGGAGAPGVVVVWGYN